MKLNVDDFDLVYEASCVVFAFVLRKRFDAMRVQEGKGFKGLSVFDADKTLRLLDKLWTRRPKPSRQGRLVEFPVTEMNDKHGHRVAFAIEVDNALHPVLTGMMTFDDQSKPASRTLLIHKQDEPWGSVELIEPQVSGANLARLCKQGFLEVRDVQFLEELGRVLADAELSERHIIAVGRHETPEATRDSVLYEFKRWIAWTSDCVDILTDPAIASDEHLLGRLGRAAWQCWSFARECVLKVRDERISYDEACQRLLKAAAKHPDVLATLRLAQQTSESIWGSEHVAPLVFSAYYCSAFAQYLAGSLRRLPGLEPYLKRANVTPEQAKDAFLQLRYFNSLDPASRPLSFDPDSVNWAALGPATTDPALPDPEQLRAASQPCYELGSHLKTVLDHIQRSYLAPDMQRSRRAAI